MSMDHPSADTSVTNLPLSDLRCVAAGEDCLAFLAAENQSQELVPFAGQFQYGHWTTYYYVVIIFILMVVHGVHLWQDCRSWVETKESTAPSFRQKTLAAGRYILYRRITLWPIDRLGLPSCGMLVFLLATLLYLTVLDFAVRPYYREHLGYGSPPLAVRSGLMAFACTPILIALVGKANLITLLTGISHEKLNVVHRWVAWMSFALSMIHTIPYFVASHNDGGPAQVKTEFYMHGVRGKNEYSGAPPLAILFGLCVLSLPTFRHRFHKAFYHAHILLAITYIGLLFWHAGDEIDSWAYLWATIALWLASYLARAFWFTPPLNIRNTWFKGERTSFLQLPGDMTRIEVLAPPGFSHTPAQHCFLRFPAISLLENHPFTITSTPHSVDHATAKAASGGVDDELRNPQTLIFLARSRAGFTRKLAAYCASHPSYPASAWVDGPYGGIGRPIERLYDTLILVAGGTGITPCLSLLSSVIGQSERSHIRIKRIVLVWVMREAQHFAWAEETLEKVAAVQQKKVAVQMKFYVTDGARPAAAPKVVNVDTAEKAPGVMETGLNGSFPKSRMANLGECFDGRPDTGIIVREQVGPGKTLVFGCGPENLRDDLANACSGMQLRVIRGKMQEVVMHMEVFGW